MATVPFAIAGNDTRGARNYHKRSGCARAGVHGLRSGRIPRAGPFFPPPSRRRDRWPIATLSPDRRLAAPKQPAEGGPPRGPPLKRSAGVPVRRRAPSHELNVEGRSHRRNRRGQFLNQVVHGSRIVAEESAKNLTSWHWPSRALYVVPRIRRADRTEAFLRCRKRCRRSSAAKRENASSLGKRTRWISYGNSIERAITSAPEGRSRRRSSPPCSSMSGSAIASNSSKTRSWPGFRYTSWVMNTMRRQYE